MLVEGLLDGMELPVLGEALDRRDLAPVGLDGEHRAGLHRLPVEEHGARAARGGVTADDGSRQAEPLAQEVDEQLARLDLLLPEGSVDRDRDGSQTGLLPKMPASLRRTDEKKSENPETGFAWAATARCASSGAARELGLQALGEAVHELGGDVLHHPAAVLGHGPREGKVGDDVDPRAAAVQRGERGLYGGVRAAAVAHLARLRAQLDAPRGLVHLFPAHVGGEGEPDGPELDLHRRLPVGVVHGLVKRGSGHAGDDAGDVHEEIPGGLGRRVDLEGVLELHAVAGAFCLRKVATISAATAIATSSGVREPMSSPIGAWTRSSASVGDARSSQTLGALLVRAPAAHRADVAGRRLERDLEQRDVELVVVGEDADRRALVHGRVPQELVRPRDDEVVHVGEALLGDELRARVADGDAVAEEAADRRDGGGVVDGAEDVHVRPRREGVDEDVLVRSLDEPRVAVRRDEALASDLGAGDRLSRARSAPPP